MSMTIGIDLGTTNSVMSIKKLNLTTILNAEGEELTPSCVTAMQNADNATPEYIVGRHSRDLLKQYPEQTITSIKRLMGRDFEDSEVQGIIKEHRISYGIVTEVSEPGSIRIPLAGTMQTPEMISGIIIKKLIHDGEMALNGKITQAVVTVPAYFYDRQKFATRAACDYAGIKLLRLLSEPTAAALSFGLDVLEKDAVRTVMVFDFGGGTFDISVLSFSDGNFMEITKGGDMWLGGDNIDHLLTDHIFACVQKVENCKPIPELLEMLPASDKIRFLVELKEKSEAAKIALSSNDTATIDMFGVLKDENHKLIDINVRITRAEFDAMLQPIIQRVSTLTKQILYEVRFEPELIDTVLMVGGSSLIPAIQDELKRIFGAAKVMVHPRPMLAVAEGAALMAAKIISQEIINDSASFEIMHTTAHDYYLQLVGGKKHLLVARNTPLPITVEESLSFARSDQSLARLRVFNATDGTLDTVGEIWFHKEEQDSNPSANKKDALTQFTLSFSVDEDNIITMKAWSQHNTQVCVESKIVRGGLAAKLYNDLENTLSSIIANCRSASTEFDILRLSRNITATIHAASDPITGETIVAQKQKAQRQIQTLKELSQRDLSPVSVYEFAVLAQTEASDILSAADKSRLANLLEKYDLIIKELDDIEKFEQIDEELRKFYEQTPMSRELARAENIASCLHDAEPDLAKQLRSRVKKVIDAYKSKNEALIESAGDALNYMLSTFSHQNIPSRRFDRDVQI